MQHSVEEVKLKCGAKGLLIDIPDAPVFVMELWFRAGDSKVKDAHKFEAAHIMEHMACGANAQHKSKKDVDRYINKYGAYSNAWTSKDHLSYIRVCPDFDYKRILDQLVTQVTAPKFLDKEFKAEFGNVEEEMRLRHNNHWRELIDKMNQKFGFTYSDTCLERLQKMQSVKVDDIREHYKLTHGAKNMTFFIAGNLARERANILSSLEGLEALPSTKRFNLSAYPTVKSIDKPVVVKKSDVPNVYLYFEMYATSPKDKLYLQNLNLAILCKILGEGDHSRIYGRARQRGLVYSMGSSKSVSEGGHYDLNIYAQVGVENIDKLVDLIIYEFKNIIKKGFTKKEVNEAVESMRGGMRMDNQTASDIAHWHSGWYTSKEEETVMDYAEVDAWFSEITPQSIERLFIKLIKTNVWGAGFLGNIKAERAKELNKKLSDIFS